MNARRNRHRGISSIYIVLIFFILFFFVSIGVDMGRVRVARNQLQTAADAASFAGAQGLPTANLDIAAGRAIAVAAENRTDGAPVDVDAAQDIEFGLYRITGRTYTPVGSAEPSGHVVVESDANAIKVTPKRLATRGNPIGLTFARVVGRSTFDVWTTATAVVLGGPTNFGIVGIDWIHGNGTQIMIDSYNPNLGPYHSQTPGNNGSIASNGPIELGNADVHGDVRPGVNQFVTQGPTSHVTGWTAPLDQPLVYPPATVPPGCTNLNNFRPPDGFHLAGGTLSSPLKYRCTNFDTNKTLYIDGAVEIYVEGNVRLRGASVVSGTIPANFKLFVIGENTSVELGGNSELFAHVYAPQSDVTIHGTPGFYGAIVGQNLELKGVCNLHYDESAPPINIPRRSMLVR